MEAGRGLLQQTQEQARLQAKLELELEAIEERLRLAGEEAREGGWRLADRIEVDRGYETALAAALGGRLGARVVASVAEAAAAVERAGDGGTRALVSGGSPIEAEPGAPPAPGAERLSDRVRPASELRAVVDRAPGAGVGGGADRRRARRLHRDRRHTRRRRIRRTPRARRGGCRRAAPSGRSRNAPGARSFTPCSSGRPPSARRLQAETDRATLAEREAEERRDVLEGELRELGRRQSEAVETARRCAWLIEQRREHGVGPEDARRAELSGEITAERRLFEQLERERSERAARRRRLEALAVHDRALVPAAERLVAAIAEARAAVTRQP